MALPEIPRLLDPLRAARDVGPEAVVHAVHGLILFLAVVGATFVADEPAWRVAVFPAGAVVLFWTAHVYAATLAHPHAAEATARTTARREARRALPLVEAPLVPGVPLLLAVPGWVPLDLAYSAGVTIGVAALAAVGFLARRHRAAPLRRALLAAVATGGLGAAIIAAETFWH